MAKLNIKLKLQHRRGKKVSKFLYHFFFSVVAKPFLIPKMNIQLIDNVGQKNIKSPFFVVSNHTSRCDYLYVSSALKSHTLNYMVSYTEFFRSHMHLIFDFLHVVPKKNFISDLHAIKELTQVINDGGNVAFFPEGKSSISGTNQPVMLGTGKLFKHFKLPVYVTKIQGGYMSNTQWNIANRPGKVIVTLDKLFDGDDFEKLSPEEMEEKLNRAIFNDDFEWNKTERIKYKGNNTVADKLEEHLYLCPKCNKELTLAGKGNVIQCSNCGNGAVINDYYDLIPLTDNCVIPKTLRVWYELQRRKIYFEIKQNENFELREHVILGALPIDHYINKKYTSEKVGEGELILNRHELSFIGTRDGKPFEFHENILNVPTLLLETDSSYFGTFATGEYLEFTPTNKVTTKWLLATEECHRLAGGKWQNVIPEQQWIYEDENEEDKNKYYL